MREKILKMILDKGENFISGEEIAENIGITRTAVWKHINNLKKQGYDIESVNKKGYRIKEQHNDLLIKENVKYQLNTELIGEEIIHFETIESTNDYAKKIAEESIDGTIVISEEQTKGRGRIGRKWHSKKGDGIWMSIILKPNMNPYESPFITLIAGASIVKALNNLGVEATIKWPNDIVINSKKMCGILTELSAEIDRINYVVLGIGINVKTLKFDDEIKDIATSLYNEGYSISRIDIIKNIIIEFENLYLDYVKNRSKENTLDVCRKYSAIIGKDIYTIQGENKEKVKCLDIDDYGNLVVETKSGEIKNVMSGEVSIRGEKGYV